MKESLRNNVIGIRDYILRMSLITIAIRGVYKSSPTFSLLTEGRLRCVFKPIPLNTDTRGFLPFTQTKSAEQSKKSRKIASPQNTADIFRIFPNGMTRTI